MRKIHHNIGLIDNLNLLFLALNVDCQTTQLDAHCFPSWWPDLQFYASDKVSEEYWDPQSGLFV